jgi:hypothetical protein
VASRQYSRRWSDDDGGVLTGRGADIILIDDRLKPEEALSDTARPAATGSRPSGPTIGIVSVASWANIRDGKAERHVGLLVHYKLKPGRLLNENIGRFGPRHHLDEQMRCLSLHRGNAPMKTIGIVEVAFLAASATRSPTLVAIKSTLRPTRSTANEGTRS